MSDTNPVSRPERLEHVDALRGAALFGVLMMNLFTFAQPEGRVLELEESWPNLAEGLVSFACSVLLNHKAMTMFSMLFAVGLCIQKERMEARGRPFAPFARRRLGALLAFGVLHIVLLWWGDILHTYALGGLLLLLFLGRKARTVWIWSACLWGLTLVLVSVFAGVRMAADGAVLPTAEEIAAVRSWSDQCLAAYGHGSWSQILAFRLGDYAHQAPMEAVALLVAFFNFLVGVGIWKSGVLRDPAMHLPRLRRVATWGLGFGLVVGLGNAFLETPLARSWATGHWSAYRWLLPLRPLGVVQPMTLALGYGAGLLLLWQGDFWRRRLGFLTWLGRMAFTNYLTQSLIMTSVFYAFGLGLYDRTGMPLALLMGVCLYALQAVASRWWLSRFQFGPMEWVWRCLSYGRLQPFRLRGAALE